MLRRAPQVASPATVAFALILPALASAQLVPGRWVQTWADEFNTGSSDLASFSYDLGGGGWGNQELETYTNSSANASVSGGSLHITAIASGAGSSQTYTSARLKTKSSFSQAYGLFEFRAALPQGQGLWPAVWMMPRDSVYGGWPTSGEIDILESKGQDSRLVQGSLQSGPAWNQLNTQTLTFSSSGQEPANFSTAAWHTYDLLWTAGSPYHAATLQWYVDGVLYQTRTGGWTRPASAPAGDYDAPFDQPFYFILNLAVGGTYGGTPSLAAGSYQMQVDYLRTYRLFGDATGDGLVNSADLAVLDRNLGKSVTGGYASADFNFDGRVNADDYALFDKARAAAGSPSSPAGVVPEPSALLPAALALAAATVPRRRR